MLRDSPRFLALLRRPTHVFASPSFPLGSPPTPTLTLETPSTLCNLKASRSKPWWNASESRRHYQEPYTKLMAASGYRPRSNSMQLLFHAASRLGARPTSTPNALRGPIGTLYRTLFQNVTVLKRRLKSQGARWRFGVGLPSGCIAW